MKHFRRNANGSLERELSELLAIEGVLSSAVFRKRSERLGMTSSPPIASRPQLDA